MTPESLYSLDGKVALVTGATSGIGQQQALALARAGADVVAVGRRQDRLDTLADTAKQQNLSVKTLAADVANHHTVHTVAADAIGLFGQIDILINAAGVNLRQPVDDITPESWDQTLNLNLATPFFLARACVDDMKKRGFGRILNIASLQSTRAFPNGLPYGASKGGITQLTRAMSEAWSALGINANAIAPGFFPTELTAPVFGDDSLADRMAAQTTIGRNGRLDDLDGVTVFLCSHASDYITGQTLAVDGGFTAK